MSTTWHLPWSKLARRSLLSNGQGPKRLLKHSARRRSWTLDPKVGDGSKPRGKPMQAQCIPMLYCKPSDGTCLCRTRDATRSHLSNLLSVSPTLLGQGKRFKRSWLQLWKRLRNCKSPNPRCDGCCMYLVFFARTRPTVTCLLKYIEHATGYIIQPCLFSPQDWEVLASLNLKTSQPISKSSQIIRIVPFFFFHWKAIVPLGRTETDPYVWTTVQEKQSHRETVEQFQDGRFEHGTNRTCYCNWFV